MQSYALLSEGQEATVYLEGSDTIVKAFKSTALGAARAQREEYVLRFLEAKAYSVPKPIGRLKFGERHALRMSYVDGDTLEDDFHTVSGVGSLAGRTLAEAHATLHTLSAVDLGRLIPSANEHFSSGAASSGLGAVLQIASSGLNDVLCHGDFHPGNIIVSASGPVIIDWTRAYIGPRESDIATTVLRIHCAAPSAQATAEQRDCFLSNAASCRKSYLSYFFELGSPDKNLISQWLQLAAADEGPPTIPSS